MTRPWEETWRWDEKRSMVLSDYEHPTDEDGGIIVRTDSGCYPPYHGGRRDLLVQAPAMARLLLELQWSGSEDGFIGSCPSCRRYPSPNDTAPWPLHAPDCELVKVLRAAGVIEPG